jgi:hypothetical protein
MIDRILKGGSYFTSLFFVASFIVMQSGGCELPSQKPEFTKEVVTITAPSIEEKTEEKIKDDKDETSTGKSTEDKTTDSTDSEETSLTSECVCK